MGATGAHCAITLQNSDDKGIGHHSTAAQGVQIAEGTDLQDAFGQRSMGFVESASTRTIGFTARPASVHVWGGAAPPNGGRRLVVADPAGVAGDLLLAAQPLPMLVAHLLAHVLRHTTPQIAPANLFL